MPKFEIDTDAGTVTVDGVNFVPEAAAPAGDAGVVTSDETAAATAVAPGGDEVPAADSGGDAAVETPDTTVTDAAGVGDPAAAGDEAPAGDEPAPVESTETQT